MSVYPDEDRFPEQHYLDEHSCYGRGFIPVQPEPLNGEAASQSYHAAQYPSRATIQSARLGEVDKLAGVSHECQQIIERDQGRHDKGSGVDVSDLVTKTSEKLEDRSVPTSPKEASATQVVNALAPSAKEQENDTRAQKLVKLLGWRMAVDAQRIPLGPTLPTSEFAIGENRAKPDTDKQWLADEGRLQDATANELGLLPRKTIAEQVVYFVGKSRTNQRAILERLTGTHSPKKRGFTREKRG